MSPRNALFRRAVVELQDLNLALVLGLNRVAAEDGRNESYDRNEEDSEPYGNVL